MTRTGVQQPTRPWAGGVCSGPWLSQSERSWAWSQPGFPPPILTWGPLRGPGPPALQAFPWRPSRGNGLALPHHKERPYTIASALPKPCFFEDVYGPYAKASEKGPYFLTEYSTHQLFSQLTLLQQVGRAGEAPRARSPGSASGLPVLRAAWVQGLPSWSWAPSPQALLPSPPPPSLGRGWQPLSYGESLAPSHVTGDALAPGAA